MNDLPAVVVRARTISVTILGLLLAAWPAATATVEISSVPSALVLYRDVTGPYERHPEIFVEMMRYAGANYRAVGACFGVYPQDPDAVDPENLHWQVGVRVLPGAPLGYANNLPIEQLPAKTETEWQRVLRTMKTPQKPYALKVISATSAAVFRSSVAEAGRDGLAMFPWMANNGYVQTGPTRMEYLSHDGPPEAIQVSIVVPVKKRASGLKTQDK